MNALNGHAIHGVRLHISLYDTPSPSVPQDAAASPITTTGMESRVYTFPSVPCPQSCSQQLETPIGIPFPSKESPSELGDEQACQHLPPFPSNRPTLHYSISEQNLRGRPRSRSVSASPSPARQQQSPLSSYCRFSNNDNNIIQGESVSTSAHPRVHTPPQHVHGRRISNIYHFDSVGRTMLELPPTAPRPRSISVSSETDSPVAGRLAIPLPTSPTANPKSELSTAFDTKPTMYECPLDLPTHCQWPAPEPIFNASPPITDVSLPQSPSRPPALKLHIPRRHLISRQRTGAHGTLGLEAPIDKEKERDPQPERNKIDIGKIQRGEETRTTVRQVLSLQVC